MNSVFICFVAAVISLQIFVGVTATDAEKYQKAKAETLKLWTQGEKLRKYIRTESAAQDVVMAAGVKSGTQYIRAYTSTPLANGQPAYGSNLTDPNTIKQLNAGKPAKGEVELFGTRYLTYFIPVLDKNNKVIGFYGVGVPA